MKLIVDTNIVFSAILNSDSNIAQLLLNSRDKFRFYSCEFLKHEINSHKNKILKITNYTEQDFLEIEYLATKNITFINHQFIEAKKLEKAQLLCQSIDIKDAPFIALGIDLKAKLWTGDKILYQDLKEKKYKDVITTAELIRLK